MQIDEMQQIIESAYRNETAIEDAHEAITKAIAMLDRGQIRVARQNEADWTVHSWVKEAILLFFRIQTMDVMEVGPFEFHDKMPLKKDLAAAGVRVVPPGVARYGAHLEKGAILMPGYVNIGAYVGSGTMVDTWATVGSCAQIGSGVHLSGGVGIGGVLEPPGATPVIIEDGAFIGSRCVVVEGVRIGKEAVLGANTVITASTKILDVRGDEVVELQGEVPSRAVVIPGTRPKKFPAGEFGVPCALIIGERKESTDKKVSLNAALRDFGVAV